MKDLETILNEMGEINKAVAELRARSARWIFEQEYVLKQRAYVLLFKDVKEQTEYKRFMSIVHKLRDKKYDGYDERVDLIFSGLVILQRKGWDKD